MRYVHAAFCFITFGPLAFAQNDLLVDNTQTSAYQTLQAALDAAQPGDRIRIAHVGQATSTVVAKSVTIEAIGSSPVTLTYDNGSGSGHCGIRVATLTPGLPLILRRLVLEFSPFLWRSNELSLRIDAPGEVQLEDINFRQSAFGANYTQTFLNANCTKLWLKRCDMQFMDMTPTYWCFDTSNWNGSSCVSFNGQFLVMEDCVVRASSAAYLRYYVGAGSLCNERPIGGGGGSALRAAAGSIVIVRSTLSDGNGGSLEPALWKGTAVAGSRGLSTFGSRLSAYGSTYQHGIDGVIATNPSSARANTGLLGTQPGFTIATLTFTGTPSLGGSITLNNSGSPSFNATCGAVVGSAWAAYDALGNGAICVALDPSMVALPSALGPWSVTLPIPNVTSLLGFQLVAQLYCNNAGDLPLVFGNAVGVTIRK